MSNSCTRRLFASGLAGGLLTACSGAGGNLRLTSRPGKNPSGCEPGVHPLALRRERDTLFYVPKGADPGKPSPLVVYLHGATGSEQQGITRLSGLAEELGFLLLSPASEGGTWDAMEDVYGHDVRMIDQSLSSVFERRRVDPKRIALAGFSDGGSYALGLGLGNGDLFGAVLAFSPGLIPAGSTQKGTPRVFVSHGRKDRILPIEQCSRRIVPELQRAGYPVTYREFDGPHTVPPEIASDAMKWFLG
jgi:phospholipase/carboxylesterase